MGGGIAIERTCDLETIRELALHPRIFPYISDDFTANQKTWKPIDSELVRYLLAEDAEGPFGFGVFIPTTWAHWTAHFAFLPRAYGADARKSLESMFAWMWENTSARRITGEIVKGNTLAIRFARRAGCEIYGINRKSYLRGGILHDQVCLGISKPL